MIMAAHNAEKTILESVTAVLRHLPLNGELLIFDDASTDHTRSIVANISDPRIRRFASADKVGRSQARNLLIEESLREWLAIVDADDIVLRGRFNLTPSDLGKSVIASTALIRFESRFSATVPQFPLALNSKEIVSALTRLNPLVHSSITMRKDAFLRAGGYQDVQSEDYNLWVQMALNGESFKRHAIPRIIYRVHSSQVSQSSSYKLGRIDPVTAGLAEELSKNLGPEASLYSRSLKGRLEVSGLSNLRRALIRILGPK